MLVFVIYQHEWVTDIHMSLPSWNSIPSLTPSHPSRLSERTRLNSLCHRANSVSIYFTYVSVYVSMLFFLFFPPSPSPTISISLFSMSKSALLCLFTKLGPTLCNPMNCSPPGSYVHGDSTGKNTGVGCHVLLQGIFLTQGLNPYCRWILYHLIHEGCHLLTLKIGSSVPSF